MRLSLLLLAAALTPVVLGTWAFLCYPLGVYLAAQLRMRRGQPARAERGRKSATRMRQPPPRLDVVLVCHNAAGELAAALDAILTSNYPRSRRRVLVVSDASNDGTDAVAVRYAARGVSLLRLAKRAGKTEAENVAASSLTGDIAVFVDAASRLQGDALRALADAFDDPTVGVASGRDDCADARGRLPSIRSMYVRFEMWIRRSETRLGSIVGASGCLYAVRRPLVDTVLPPHLTRDFAVALAARRHGFRCVSVDGACCEVRHAANVAGEWRRMERTMLQGIATLVHHREMLNPRRYGVFAVALLSHKLARWLTWATALPALGALAALTLLTTGPGSDAVLALIGGVATLGAIGRWWPRALASRILEAPALALGAKIGAARALARVATGERLATWEPTRRER